MKYGSSFILLLLIITSLPGCDSSRNVSITDYETISANVARDTATARLLNDQAVLAIESGDIESAERLLKESLTADVMYGAAHNNLGRVYFEQSRYYLAAWEFQNAARLMPYQAEPRNNLGLVFEHTGKLEDAINWYTQAMEFEPDNPVLLGNLVRARLRSGLRDEETHALLEQLVMIEDRPEWRAWAERENALFKMRPTTDQGIESE